ncbi:hypothetical protein AB0P21_05980 [Kribbella sp. NPDC056861]|uniref:hypothetical protein n=1 Tax=Kribbella sp. NPDC056861 TaxID=3154857 RepID=UPI003441DFF4
MAVGGVDTYYDYDERQWKSRRLGGRPVRIGPVVPVPAAKTPAKDSPKQPRREKQS